MKNYISIKKRARMQIFVAAIGIIPFYSFATNGMNMEGYGPVSAAMGGAGMSYDNGTAAIMNNPATLGLMQDGLHLNVAAGFMNPSVSSNTQGSSATSFIMPALGVVKKDGKFAYGFGIFSQGGMGTEYPSSDYLGRLSSMAGNFVPSSSLINRSEVGVGRAILPVAWKIDETLTVGATLDYVWVSMDMQMLVDGKHFGSLMQPGAQMGSAGGSMVNAMNNAFALGQVTDVNWGYFDFSNDNRWSGQAKGAGTGGKLGFTHKVNSKWTWGASYHAKINFSDLVANSASLTFNMETPGGNAIQTLTGKLKVQGFAWPNMYGVGASFKPDDEWLVVADIRRIGWADTMKKMSMRFDTSSALSNGSFANTSLDMSLNQNWKDQYVVMLGASYQANDTWTYRGGLNLANNPVPADVTNPLFPAVVTNHLTAGFQYKFSKYSAFDLSLSYAPQVTVVNSAALGATDNQKISHGQTNGQLLYSYRF
ncbi:OmpP1/FadL family transporter [Propionivibrio sp.]|uniref:OmpP1/FadL family transporter n=1 Tax=Propionivibrio sp. TaxID=2212460 RepID=UPI003BF2818F